MDDLGVLMKSEDSQGRYSLLVFFINGETVYERARHPRILMVRLVLLASSLKK